MYNANSASQMANYSTLLASIVKNIEQYDFNFQLTTNTAIVTKQTHRLSHLSYF